MFLLGRIGMENHHGWPELQKRKEREIRVRKVRQNPPLDHVGRGSGRRINRKFQKRKNRTLCVGQIRKDTSVYDG